MKLTAFAFEIKDGVAHITCDQGERGNPIDRAFAHEFNELATECTVNPEVRAVLIDARGRFFGVGGDLNALASSREGLARFIPDATADLQVLDKNPLDDIRNTNTIAYVMRNGRLYEGATLKEIYPREREIAPPYWWRPAEQ